MTEVRVHCVTMSVDGFVAGSHQSLDHPLGIGAEPLHHWIFATRTFRAMTGEGGGSTGLDDAYMAAGFDGIGATIMGRNMFGPVRGAWPDASWRGWWGDRPPFGHPVFVLTHHPRPSIEMQGGTVFHFVSGEVRELRDRAVDAAGGLDVRIGGGAATIRQFLLAGLVDHFQFAVAPVVLGDGEPLLAGIDLPELGYRDVRIEPSEAVTHITARRGTAGHPAS